MVPWQRVPKQRAVPHKKPIDKAYRMRRQARHRYNLAHRRRLLPQDTTAAAKSSAEAERRAAAKAQLRLFLAHGDSNAEYRHPNAPNWALRLQIKALRGLKSGLHPELDASQLTSKQIQAKRLWFAVEAVGTGVGICVLIIVVARIFGY